MALKATVYKARLQIADMERHYYGEHHLTLARHPSETDERMMLRLLAFARHAHPDLAFGRGVSTDDEPDLWQKTLTDEIALWIQLGQPEERDVRRACARAQQVVIYSYGGQAAEAWWEQHAGRLRSHANLTVIDVAPASVKALGTLAARTMALNATLQDGLVWLATPDASVEVTLNERLASRSR